MSSKKQTSSKTKEMKPVALILAGYDKFDSKTKLKKMQELIEAYDGDIIYMGHNKFLHRLEGKPIIQYVLDAVYNAKSGSKNTAGKNSRLYEKIFIYNDIRSFEGVVDLSKYDNVHLHQMTDSVGGHWKDFYFNYIEYGQRVDVFFGDTPRITSEDVEYIHHEFSTIIGRERDHRGALINMVFGIVDYEDMKDDNWLNHRIKYIKRGQNKGKLKSFVGYEGRQVRVGNTGAVIKHESNDALMEHESINFIYNLRKALSPSTFSKIVYHLWKSKHFDMIRQVKNKCIREVDFYNSVFDIISKLNKIDLSNYGGKLILIKKNAARWENDIDGPMDLNVFQQKFREMLGKK